VDRKNEILQRWDSDFNPQKTRSFFSRQDENIRRNDIFRKIAAACGLSLLHQKATRRKNFHIGSAISPGRWDSTIKSPFCPEPDPTMVKDGVRMPIVKHLRAVRGSSRSPSHN